MHELALQIARLMKMNDPRRGITVQATVVAGGTVSNVVPAHARAEVDIRYARLADAPRLEREAARPAADLERARIEVRGGINRPPLERTRRRAQAFRQAQSLMREMGVELGEPPPAADRTEIYGGAGRAHARWAGSCRQWRAQP